MIKRISILLICLASWSCSKYIQYLQNTENPDYELKPIPEKTRFCLKPNEVNLVHNSVFTFQEFPSEILNSKILNIIDKGILLTLFQFHVRPESTDWSSRTQIHLKIDNISLHNDYGNTSNAPLLLAMKDIIKKRYSSKKLDYLIKLSNKSFPKKLTIQKAFNEFLSYSKKINKKQEERLFKLGSPLQVGETFKRTSIVIPKFTLNNTSTFPHNFPIEEGNSNFTCSFDSGLYKKGIFLISGTVDYENFFGVYDNKGNYFLAYTKKEPATSLAYPSQLFPGKPSQSLSPYCLFKDKGRELILMGGKSRDPGQLLFHLFNYGIFDYQTPQDISQYLSFPRHQFLTKPSRLLYESQRGTQKQLRYFLSLDFPIYHTEKLGSIHAMMSEPNNKNSYFISDDRTDVQQTCIK